MVHCIALYMIIMPAKFQLFIFLHCRKIRFSVNRVFESSKMGVVQFMGVVPWEFKEFKSNLKIRNFKQYDIWCYNKSFSNGYKSF